MQAQGIAKSFLNAHSRFLFINWFVFLMLAYAVQELQVTLKHMLRHYICIAFISPTDFYIHS